MDALGSFPHLAQPASFSKHLIEADLAGLGLFPFSGLAGVKVETGKVLFTVKVVGVDLQ